ncbi:hypothetical protein ACA758_00910 [Mycoplasmopsis agassizii]|uniref:sodium:solute symporter family transporter n=1 Tax=Mycoplasmopsis agassizii TaxID=33922 RepID=UPI0035296312
MQKQLHAVDWVLMILYFVVVLAISFVTWWYQRKRKLTKDSKTFFDGGGKVNPIFVGLSMWSTILSSIFFVSTVGNTIANGWMWTAANVALIGVTPLVTMFVIPFYRRFKSTTAYSYLETRFGYSTRALTSILFILFQIFRVAVVLYIPTLALSIFVNINPYALLFIITLIVVVTSIFGGFKSVLYNDSLQGIVLLGGMILVLGFALAKGQNLAHSSGTALPLQEILTKKNFELTVAQSGFVFIFVFNIINSMYTFMGSQDVVQRYKATRSVSTVKRTLWITAGLGVVTVLLFFGAGSAVWSYYTAQGYNLAMNGVDSSAKFHAITSAYAENGTNVTPKLIDTAANSLGLTSAEAYKTDANMQAVLTRVGELNAGAANQISVSLKHGNQTAILPWFIASELPIGVVGIIFAAIFAASQSTVSSGLSAMVQTIMVDFVNRWRPGIKDQTKTLISKILILVFGVWAFAFGSLIVFSGEGDFVGYITGIIGLFNAPIFGAFVLALYTTRSNKWGVFTAMLVVFFGTLPVWALTQSFTPAASKIVFNGQWLTIVSFVATVSIGYSLSIVTNQLFPKLKPVLASLENQTWFTRTAAFKEAVKFEAGINKLERKLFWGKLMRKKDAETVNLENEVKAKLLQLDEMNQSLVI